MHCRDWEQSYKATIKSVMETAKRNGVVAIVDMPNTQPALTTRELVEKRLETALSEGVTSGYYLYVGATADPKQLREAVEIIDENPKVLGMKLYAGKSTGDLGISDEKSQSMIYKTLAEVGYNGVIMLHCEKEDMFNMALWDPSRPYTWNMARPPQAEVESIKDQIRLLQEHAVKAHLHICHISAPESVEIVDDARSSMRISCGATPHHLMLSTNDMQSEDGVAYKVNPPLRDFNSMRMLREMLKAGRIDLIESDHAPHSNGEKAFAVGKSAGSYMSGIPSLNIYSKLIEGLLFDGFTAAQIKELTYSNAKKMFPKIKE